MLLTGAWYLFLISLSSLLPAVLGSEFGFRRLYIKLLVDLFDWATGKGLAIILPNVSVECLFRGELLIFERPNR